MEPRSRPPAAGAGPRPPRVTPDSRGGQPSPAQRGPALSRPLAVALEAPRRSRGSGSLLPGTVPPHPPRLRCGRAAVLAAASHRHRPASGPRGALAEAEAATAPRSWLAAAGPADMKGRGVAGSRGRSASCSASHAPECEVSICRASAKIPDSELPQLCWAEKGRCGSVTCPSSAGKLPAERQCLNVLSRVGPGPDSHRGGLLHGLGPSASCFSK